MMLATAKVLVFTGGLLALAMVVALVLLGCQKPIPYTPEQLRDWSPANGATDYPPLSVGGARDAGADR